MRRAHSLIEVTVALVVLSIIAAVAAVGVGTFLGRAGEGAAGGRLEVVIAAELRFAQSWSNFTPLPADLEVVDEVVVTGPATGDVVSIAVGASGDLGVAAVAGEGCVAKRVPAPGSGGGPVEVAVTGPCDGAGALSGGDSALAPVSARW